MSQKKANFEYSDAKLSRVKRVRRAFSDQAGSFGNLIRSWRKGQPRQDECTSPPNSPIDPTFSATPEVGARSFLRPSRSALKYPNARKLRCDHDLDTSDEDEDLEANPDAQVTGAYSNPGQIGKLGTIRASASEQDFAEQNLQGSRPIPKQQFRARINRAVSFNIEEKKPSPSSFYQFGKKRFSRILPMFNMDEPLPSTVEMKLPTKLPDNPLAVVPRPESDLQVACYCTYGKLNRMKRTLSLRVKQALAGSSGVRGLRRTLSSIGRSRKKGMVRKVPRPNQLVAYGMRGEDERNAYSEDESTHFVRMRKTISSDALMQDRRSESPHFDRDEIRSPGSVSSGGSSDKRGDDAIHKLVKKRKYFSERNKNIFKKLIHPSYHERNSQYRRLFGDMVEEQDLFLISFSCAYQREILVQGRMYISQRNICFHANILGWETKFLIPFSKVVNITREKAALIFPNSIQLETDSGEKYFFASFMSREKTTAALKLVLSTLKEHQREISPEEMWEMWNAADEKKTPSSRPNSAILEYADPMATPSPSQIMMDRASQRSNESGNMNLGSASSSVGSSPAPGAEVEGHEEYPAVVDQGPQESSDESSEPISCPCDKHFGRMLMDSVFNISVVELRELLFTDSPWFNQLQTILKNSEFSRIATNVTEYRAAPWATDKDGNMNRTCTYTLALNHAMAPKNCQVTEKQIINTFGRAGDGFHVSKETQNAGVPYAESFTVDCSYCVTRVNRTQCRIQVYGGLNYKSRVFAFIKNFIEKNTHQGLDEHYQALEASLTEECDRRLQIRSSQADNESLSSVEDPIMFTDSPVVMRRDVTVTMSASSGTRRKSTAPGTSHSHNHRDRQLSPSSAVRIAAGGPDVDPPVPTRHRRISTSGTSSSAVNRHRHRASIDVTTTKADVPDYRTLIWVIIGLLSVFLLFSIMSHWQMGSMEARMGQLSVQMENLNGRLSSSGLVPSQSQKPDTPALESLIGTVEQLAAELHKLKSQMSRNKNEL